MGNFSRDTFDRLKHYIGVRLQQGVPIVDADWNELEDIRRYELQAFLKWFVGNGVPGNNPGFAILPCSQPNDFIIRGGDGTPEGAGRCIVDGWDVINESDIAYSAQALFNTTLASDWGVPPLTPLNTPGADRTDTVYLDVWEREVDSGEDTNLVNPAIGIETAVRLKREWVVRVSEGAPPPPPAVNHLFYPLANLNRIGGEPVISAAQVQDRRLTGLSAISYHDVEQVVTDAYGMSYTLDHDGQPNLKVSLREAINAILKGGLPGTPEEAITPTGGFNFAPYAVADNNGDIWVFWYSSRSGNNDIWYDRYDSTTASWQGNTQLTTDAGADLVPDVVVGSNGDIWVFWYSNRSGNNDIWYDRYDFAAASWQGNTQLTMDTGVDSSPDGVVGANGDIWVFWQSNRSGNNDIWYDRYDFATASWDGNTPLSTGTDGDNSPRAVVDGSGDIWAFWYRLNSAASNYNIWYDHYDSAAATWDGNAELTTDTANDFTPFAVVDKNDDIWVFWYSNRSGNNDIWCRRYNLTFRYSLLTAPLFSASL